MKHLNLATHIVWATLITVALLAYAGCYNDAPNPWYNNQENTGSNGSNKATGSQQSDAGGSTQQDSDLKTGHKVIFKMPEGWSDNSQDTPTADQLILDQPSSDSVKPRVTMDLFVASEGDATMAKKFSQENGNRLVPWTDPYTSKEYKPYYKEMEVNGIKVYIAGDLNIAWGVPSWSEQMWFARDGQVYSINLDDVVDKHFDAVKTVIESIKRKN
jgi:hypothetical protein